jgi:RNA polymerase sigma factor (sigma-70 family)
MHRQNPKPVITNEALEARFGNALKAYFFKRTHDRSQADDLTQDVLAALVQRGNFESIDNIDGYVFRAAANLLQNQRRRSATRPSISFQGGADPFGILVDHQCPERILLGREQCQIIINALHELPERTRNIFILNRFEEMTGREIAARLSCSISLVEKEMIKAIAHLKSKI